MKPKLDLTPRSYEEHMRVRRRLRPHLPKAIPAAGCSTVDLWEKLRGFLKANKLSPEAMTVNDVLETAHHYKCQISGVTGPHWKHVCDGNEIIKPPVGGWK